MKKLLLLCFINLVLVNLCFASDVEYFEKLPIQKIELKRYLGSWYEIARMPNWFEKNLKNVTATYSLKPDGHIQVLNQGFDGDKQKQAIGDAWVPDPNEPGSLRVSFFWPFSAGYYVIAIDKDYEWAMVTSDTPEYLWILSRKSELDSKIYDQLLQKAKELGVNIDKMEKIR